MNKIMLAGLATLVSFATIQSASADYYDPIGSAIVGSVAGAVIGHAVGGRNGAAFGAAIGGMSGVALSVNHPYYERSRVVYDRPEPVSYYQPVQYQTVQYQPIQVAYPVHQVVYYGGGDRGDYREHDHEWHGEEHDHGWHRGWDEERGWHHGGNHDDEGGDHHGYSRY